MPDLWHLQELGAQAMSNFFPLYSVKVRTTPEGVDLCLACNQEGHFVIYEGRIVDGRYTLSLLTDETFLTFDAARRYAESDECLKPNIDRSEDAASKTTAPPKGSSRPRKDSSGSKTSTST